MQFFQISPNPGNIKQPTLDGVQQVTLSTETDAGWKIIQHHCMNKAVVLKRRKKQQREEDTSLTTQEADQGQVEVIRTRERLQITQKTQTITISTVVGPLNH